ncbi:MAG: helix-turn-helix transcriptional regulator [Clostridia bacterium]|nr:helix-turn-helix transcriptional regulator [Clostridia bacterium]
MYIKMGEKIRSLRKMKGISQETLAQYLGVSYQSVSKWENGVTMPDVCLIPAIASFFEVSTDELFDFNRMETEKRVQEICGQVAEYRDEDPLRAEKALREALRQYPGNEIILNNLLYTLQGEERRSEAVEICQTLIAATKDDEIKYDALRILAENYKAMGEYPLCRETLERIPEIYFSKLEVQAELLVGEDMFRPAAAQKHLSAVTLCDMLLRLADYYEEKDNAELAKTQLEAVIRVCDALKGDPVHEEGSRVFEDYYGREAREKAMKRLG